MQTTEAVYAKELPLFHLYNYSIFFTEIMHFYLKYLVMSENFRNFVVSMKDEGREALTTN